MKRINEKYSLGTPLQPKNDIYRKFKFQFQYLLQNPPRTGENDYVEQSSPKYEEYFNDFVANAANDVCFFVGFTGTGKSTFIRHYFNIPNAAPVLYGDDSVVVSSTWNGRTLPETGYEEEIKNHVSNALLSTLRILNEDAYRFFQLDDAQELEDYIQSTRTDILWTPDIATQREFRNDEMSLCQKVLDETRKAHPVEYASSCLKFYLKKYAQQRNQVILIVDDLETLSARKLSFLVEQYFSVYSCFHNIPNNQNPIRVKLLFSLRPHSLRFLRNQDIKRNMYNAYGVYLESNRHFLVRTDIPDVTEMITVRFNKASAAEKPGNINTWIAARDALFNLIKRFDGEYLGIVTDLCHMNIRAIYESLLIILSNRTWCQDSRPTDSVPVAYPTVNEEEYNFNSVVNVLRTLSCGESYIYYGQSNQQFNPHNLPNFLQRPTFDLSDVFIPNILSDPQNRQLDILCIYIIMYLEHKHSSDILTHDNTEFIKVQDVIDEIVVLLNLSPSDETRRHLMSIIAFLFKNRIIRKSIFDLDDDVSISVISENNYVYLTKKGSRMLKLLESNCVLLEIFREDISRNYLNQYYKSSMEFVYDKERDFLFADLIALTDEVFRCEDDYIRNVDPQKEEIFFSVFGFYNVTKMLICGVKKSLDRASGLSEKTGLLCRLREKETQINQRIAEYNNRKK